MHKKLILLLVMMIAMLCTTVVSSTTNNFPFKDVLTTTWYYDEVQTVYDEGIMEGKTSTTFDPTANMSRAEFVTVLCRLSENDYKGKGSTLTFYDTNKNAWYADYVAWGVEAEMVKGLPGNKFAPNQAVSRQEMAVFIERFVSYMSVDLKDNSKIDAFKDSKNVASFAKDAVELMRKSGIITGDQNGNFNPTNNASRAEVATVITRILPMLDTDIVITPPDIDRENFDVQKAFMYSESSLDGLLYRIYLPEDYSSGKEYPVTYFIGTNGCGTDNTSQLDDAKVLFNNINSPVFDSIVVVPQAPVVWNPLMASKLSDLVDHINSNYSIDSERIYMVAVRQGAFSSWKMMLLSPESISAVLFVHGIGPTVYGDENGNPEELIDVIPEELKDIPIRFVHDTDDGVIFEWKLGPKYGKRTSEALIKFGGFTNVHLTETSGYGAEIYKHFVSEDDASLLEWLFAQRRATK